MGPRTLIGMLTPSSNTVLEPYSSAMAADLAPEASIRFGGFRVTEISLSEQALGQFDEAPLREAAGLLKDAQTDVIAWNGTSGGWKGLGADRALCAPLAEELEREFRIPIYDTVSLTVWKSLLLCGVDPARVRGWGSLFSGRIP